LLLIDCPWCGARPEGEFVCLGEETPPRPPDPGAVADDDWAAYVTVRRNVRGPHRERWWHQRCCGRIFAIERDTLTHAVAPTPGRASP
jgi:heterotetrameric sarcosine oxidase delta subunit